MSNSIAEFANETEQRTSVYEHNKPLQAAASLFNIESNKNKYSYNFKWMSKPVIQYPQDLIAMQEIIWDVQPDLIAKTGIAHDGFLIYFASILEL